MQTPAGCCWKAADMVDPIWLLFGTVGQTLPTAAAGSFVPQRGITCRGHRFPWCKHVQSHISNLSMCIKLFICSKCECSHQNICILLVKWITIILTKRAIYTSVYLNILAEEQTDICKYLICNISRVYLWQIQVLSMYDTNVSKLHVFWIYSSLAQQWKSIKSW